MAKVACKCGFRLLHLGALLIHFVPHFRVSYLECFLRKDLKSVISIKALWDGGGKLFELQDWGMVVGQFLEKFAFTHLVPKSKVPIIIKESYALSRAEELFDMIRDYPESRDSLREFKAEIGNENKFLIYVSNQQTKKVFLNSFIPTTESKKLFLGSSIRLSQLRNLILWLETSFLKKLFLDSFI